MTAFSFFHPDDLTAALEQCSAQGWGSFGWADTEHHHRILLQKTSDTPPMVSVEYYVDRKLVSREYADSESEDITDVIFLLLETTFLPADNS